MANIVVYVTVDWDHVVEVELPPCALIADIKARLHKELGVPPPHQQLLWTKPSGSGWTLAEFGVPDGECGVRLSQSPDSPRWEDGVLLKVDDTADSSGFNIWQVPVVPLVACVDEPRDARTEPLISSICSGGRWRTGSSSTVFVAYSRGPVQVVRHGNIPGPSKQAIEGTAGPVERNGLCALWDSDADDVEAAAFVVAYTDGTLKLCRREGGAAGAPYVASSLLSAKSKSRLPTVLRAREVGAAAVRVLGKELLFVSSAGSFVDVWVRGASGDGASATAAAGAGCELGSEATLTCVVRAGRLRVHESSAVVSAMQFFADGRLACGCSNGAFTVWDLAAAVRVGSDEALTLEPVARVALPAGILELPLLADDVMGIFCIGTEEDAPGGCTLFEWRDNGSVGGRLRCRVGGLVSVSSVRLTRGVRRVVATTPVEHLFELLTWDDGVPDEATERREAEQQGPCTLQSASEGNDTGVVRQSYVGSCTSSPSDVRRWHTWMMGIGNALVALADGSVIIGEHNRGIRRLYFVNPTVKLVQSDHRGSMIRSQYRALCRLPTSNGSQLLACALPYGAVLLADKRAVERVRVVREVTVSGLVLATWSAQRDRKRQRSSAQSEAAAATAAEPLTKATTAAAAAVVKAADGTPAAARVGGEALLRTLERLPRGAMAELYLQLHVQ